MIERIMTLDTETQLLSNQVENGFDNIKAFGLSAMACYIVTPATYYSIAYSPVEPVNDHINKYTPTDHHEIQTELDSADLVVTFNGERFDFTILESAGFDMTNARSRSYDILAEFTKAAGHRISLADLAANYGMMEKSLDGADAPLLWQAAERLRNHEYSKMLYPDSISHPAVNRIGNIIADIIIEIITEYCIDDVKLTWEVFRRIWEACGFCQYTHKYKRTQRRVKLELPNELPHISHFPPEF